MTKYFTEGERRQARIAQRRRQREKRAALEGRICRRNVLRNDGRSNEWKVMAKRYYRAQKALDEGRAFQPRSLCDAHVKAYIRHKEKIKRELIGPPRPSAKLIGSVAAYRKWRYLNVPGQREKEIEKRHKAVKELKDFYIKERLGIRNPPQMLFEAKRYQLLINQLIKD